MLQFWLHAFGYVTSGIHQTDQTDSLKNIKRSVKHPLVELTWLHRENAFPCG